MLSGWTLFQVNRRGPDNQWGHLEYTAYVTNDPAHDAQEGESLDVSSDLTGMHGWKAISGRPPFSIEQNSVAISLFDDRFTTSDLAIDRASLSWRWTNGFGVPAVLDSLNFQTDSERGHARCGLGDHDAQPGGGACCGDASGAVLSTWEVDETNSNVVDFFSRDEVAWNWACSGPHQPSSTGRGDELLGCRWIRQCQPPCGGALVHPGRPG